MFKVKQWRSDGNFFIENENREHLHCGGKVYFRCPEYWPTREEAQAVLDKYQPPHVWQHGDVFIPGGGLRISMMYVHPPLDKASLLYLDPDHTACSPIDCYLINAKFLFNIQDAVKEYING